jgi:hypothetical protein
VGQYDRLAEQSYHCQAREGSTQWYNHAVPETVLEKQVVETVACQPVGIANYCSQARYQSELSNTGVLSECGKYADFYEV